MELYESLTPEQRETTMVDLGFLPAPVPLTTPLAMRLNEQTLHGWDARVGLDPTAVLSDEAADLVVRHYTGSMAFMLGFTGKADKLDEDVRLTVGDHTLVVDDSVALVDGRGRADRDVHGAARGRRTADGRTPQAREHPGRRRGHGQRDARGAAQGVPGLLIPRSVGCQSQRTRPEPSDGSVSGVVSSWAMSKRIRKTSVTSTSLVSDSPRLNARP